MKKTVVKVYIHCEKCKTKVLKAVTKLEGVNDLAIDMEKQTLTVVGDVDPVCLMKQIRKTGKVAEIVTVGPPKPPEPPEETKDKPKPCKPCNRCELYMPCEPFRPCEPYNPSEPPCSIL